MGPRRMDGFGRTGAGRPAGVPPRPVPQPRPMRPAPQPAVRPQPQQPARPQQPRAARPQQPVQQPRPKAPAKRGGGGWRVVLQFVIGLLVIVGVAAAIVALYVRYYQ